MIKAWYQMISAMNRILVGYVPLLRLYYIARTSAPKLTYGAFHVILLLARRARSVYTAADDFTDGHITTALLGATPIMSLS